MNLFQLSKKNAKIVQNTFYDVVNSKQSHTPYLLMHENSNPFTNFESKNSPKKGTFFNFFA